MSELKEISTAFFKIDNRIQELLFIMMQLELGMEESRDTKCLQVLSFLHYYLVHLEAELQEYGNKLDMYCLHTQKD